MCLAARAEIGTPFDSHGFFKESHQRNHTSFKDLDSAETLDCVPAHKQFTKDSATMQIPFRRQSLDSSVRPSVSQPHHSGGTSGRRSRREGQLPTTRRQTPGAVARAPARRVDGNLMPELKMLTPFRTVGNRTWKSGPGAFELMECQR